MQDITWQPSASIERLKQRAKILATIRQFFAERDVLEVETPLLCEYSVTDPHVIGIPALYQSLGSQEEQRKYLQTSPEYAMKRLLVAGSGSIYQISKAFRQGENGKIHNPEFTMLEWYRLDFDHHDLMDEMDELLRNVLQVGPAKRQTYQEVFLAYCNLDPHTADEAQLAKCAREKNIPVQGEWLDKNTWLDLLWTHHIEPKVANERPLFLYDFPASQSALAKIRPENPSVASRFEVYYKGVELANGFHELQDEKEQAARFEKDLVFCQQHGLPQKTIDARFLAALSEGLPACAGVAMGVDRLIMLALGCDRIEEVISFSFAIA